MINFTLKEEEKLPLEVKKLLFSKCKIVYV